LRQICDFENCR